MKRILAIVLSIAILVMAMPFSVFATTPTVATDTWDGTTTEPTTTDADGNIIINTAEEMAWVALRGDTATEGKSYKVADGIESFDMNGAVGITANSTASEVKDATATGNNWNYAEDGKVGKFMGNFDGNGVTIYNIRTIKQGYAGLFPFVYNDSTIENVTVKASYFAAYHYSAGIVGLLELQKTVNVNKCTVENCYMTDAGDTNTACTRAAAQFVAGTGNSDLNISNCFAANNILSAAGYEAGFVAKTGEYQPTGTSIMNSISIGMTPYSNAILDGSLGKGLNEKLTVENVYSDISCDVAGFTTLTTAQMQGAAAKDNMSLTWNIDWLAGEDGEYPSINYGEPIKDPYVWDGTYDEPTETDAEGNIIINSVQELAWIALNGGEATANKNYKVADGIEYFDMNGMEGITIDSSVSQVKEVGDARVAANAYSSDFNWRSTSDSNSLAFQGNFDGNGVTVYNIYSYQFANSGLFPCVDPSTQGTITIKNVTVTASYFAGYHYAGGIVGLGNASGGTGKNLIFDSCAVKNTRIYDMNKGAGHQRTVGTIVGSLSHNGTTISNCLAVDNSLSATGVVGGIFGTTSNFGSNVTVSDSISVGSPVAPTAVEVALGSKVANTTYTNVYTDQATDVAGVTTLENAKMQGSVASVTMDALDNSVWFFNTTTYPELYVFHNVVDGKCDCGLEVAGDPCAEGHTLEAVEAVEATNFTNGLLAHDKCSICGKTFIDGVEKSEEELIIPMLVQVWNGTFVEPTKTDADGNIIINTPEELAWVALKGGAATANKNYKVADGVEYFNMNGMADITIDSTAEQVKTATKNSAYLWSNASNYFMGNFDGNGLTVYNINGAVAGSYGYNGLFPAVQPENDAKAVTIKNITVMASHFEGYHYTGGIVGFVQNTSDNVGCINIDSCATKNCYFYDTVRQHHSTSGLIIGQLNHNSANVSNCLAIGNLSDMAKINGGIVGSSSNYIGSQTVSNCIVIGSLPYSTIVEGSGATIGSKTTEATVTNVYTDQTSTMTGYTTLTTAQMQGAAAKENIPFNWGMTWAVGAEGEYPSIIFNKDFYDEWDGTFVEPTTTDAEGNIIISTAEEMAWVALRGDAATTGKSYKVADGIKYFNMNGMVGVTLDSSVSDVKDAIKNDSKAWNYSADGKVGTFYGNFDGNGVTIYNIYTAKGCGYGGLFPVVKPTTESTLIIKNVAVVASYIGGYHNAGAIVGLADAPDTSTKLSLENVIVKNSFIYDNDDTNTACQRTVGVVAGNLTHNATVINNCFASGNELSAQGIIGGLFGNTSNYGSACSVSNIILLGTKVESTSINYAINDKVANTVYENVYTDQETTLETVTTLTVDEMAGTNLTLDWSGWFATTGLPELRVFHNVTSTDNGDGTHSDLCSECGLGGLSTSHVYESGACVLCGAECVHVEGEAVEENVVDASCSEEGSYDLVVYCSLCGEELSREIKTIEKSAHTEGEAVEENRVEATCAATGSYDSVVYCTVCGGEVSRNTITIEIDPEAHKFTDDNDTECDNGCGHIRELYVSGDANGDGAVNSRDAAIIMQNINGWQNAIINEAAADVNNDGAVNTKDYVLIMQHINGWDVELI